MILERHSGEIVGIEIKTPAPRPPLGDFSGLRYLRDKLGWRFKAGAVLHAGSGHRSGTGSRPCR